MVQAINCRAHSPTVGGEKGESIRILWCVIYGVGGETRSCRDEEEGEGVEEKGGVREEMVCNAVPVQANFFCSIWTHL
jgi:hypothetical protein